MLGAPPHAPSQAEFSSFDLVVAVEYNSPMDRAKLLARISIDPEICFGKPCIRGHRIWVSLVLDWLADGASVSEIVDDYDIEPADVLACIAYGAEMSRGHYVNVPGSSPLKHSA
jgi:uncharacterized protein (DUF433 family)